MPARFSSAGRLHRAILLAAVTLMTCAGALSTAEVSEKTIGTSTISDFGVSFKPSDDQTKRSLRTHTHRSHKLTQINSEERGFSITALAEAAAKKPSNQNEVLKRFSKLNLYDGRAKLFESADFKKWVIEVEKGYLKAKMNSEQASMAIVATLERQYGVKRLAEMIDAAKDAAATKNIATKLETAQMEKWAKEKVSAEAAFKNFRLNEDKFTVLQRPLLKNWVSYMETRKEDPYQWLFERLLKLDDDKSSRTLASLVGSAQQETASTPIAQKVENLLFKSWMPEKADDIFTRLRLDKGGVLLFTEPGLRTWVSYVAKRAGINADEQAYKILRSHYTEDALVAALRESKLYSADNFVERMEKAQQKVWLSEKKPAGDVFNLFKLKAQDDKMFESSAFATWAAYVTKLDEKNADEMMLSVLKETFKDEAALTRMLAAAKDHENTKTIATALEKAQYKAWRSGGESADGLFKLLKLDGQVDDLLSSPVLTNWVTYVDDLGGDSTSLLLAKLKTFNSDDKLAEMIARAQSNVNTQWIAAKLEKAELNSWLKAKEDMTVEDVFKLLKLDDDNVGIHLLWQRRVATWLAFAMEKNSRNADEAVYSVLKKYLKDDYKLGKMLTMGKGHDVEETTAKLEGIVLRVWRSKAESVDDVYDFVLKRHTQYIFQTEDFNIWRSYVMMVEKTDPYKSMLEVLQQRFGKYKLGDMLDEAAATSKYTKDFAVKLQETQRNARQKL